MQILKMVTVAIMVSLFAQTISAETLHLRNGGKVEGQITKMPDDDPKSFYLVKVDGNVTLKLSKSQVRRVEKIDPEYAMLKLEAGDSLEGHRKMERYCRERSGLKKQREFHLRSILRFDPNDEKTRRSLGYTLTTDGRWVLREQLFQSRGFVKKGASWKLPELILIEETTKKNSLYIREWTQKVKLWRGWIAKSNPKKAAEGLANIKAIKDSAAAAGLASLLLKEKDASLRRTYVEILGNLNSGTAASTLILVAVEEHDDFVREEALRVLKLRSNPGIVAQLNQYLNPQLKDNNRAKLNRAAIALGSIGHPESLQPLIDALVTEHIVMPGNKSGGDKYGAQFGGPAGGGGFKFGEKKGPTKRLFVNKGVREALRAMTDQDFEYDKNRWREWLAQKNAPKDYDLRRTKE